MSEDSESEEELKEFRPRGKSYAIPVRADQRNLYTVVPMDYGHSKKMPLHGGVEPVNMHGQQQQRIYPRLTTMRKQAGLNGKNRGPKSTDPKSVEAMGHIENDYHPDPSSLGSAKAATAPPTRKPEDDDETTTDESEEEQ